MTSTQPAMPVLDGKRCPTSVSCALAGDRLEDELVRLLVEEEDRRRLGAEDRARDLDDRLEQRAVRAPREPTTPAATAALSSSLIVRPPTFVDVR